MIHFNILTVFPEIIETYLQNGVVGQALKKGLAGYSVTNPRDFVRDQYRAVDDRPFGGGDGMVMLPDVLERALESALPIEKKSADSYENKPEQMSEQSSKKQSVAHVVYLSPQGKLLTEQKILELKEKENLVLICGRYSGLDQRVINHFVDEEISIGDFVISGGELAALALIDGVVRKLPDALGHLDSAEQDSFSKGLLEHPLFTRPQVWKDQQVPSVLLSGNHQAIESWRQNLNLLVTLRKRPELLNLDDQEKKKLAKFYSQMSAEEKEVCGVQGLEKQLGLSEGKTS